MLAAVKGAAPVAAPAAKEAAGPTAAPKSAAKEAPAAKAEATTAAAAAAPVATPPAQAPIQLAMAAPAGGEANSFNRLLKPAEKRNPAPADDGIHDPGNDGTHALMAPLTAYAGLPKSFAGNRVNWVEALGQKKIDPRWDRNDLKAEPVIMDMNVVREVKGSMPDVVYPHKQHTEWLDCSNCHPAIFVPQKGANAISMASILLGEKCGVCHGKVAFPVSECRLCHSKKKEPVPVRAQAQSPAPTAK
ncbi:MAG: cytochrome c, class I [Rhodocyclaceae bacterium]|nr:cytochrome c, class I [Rhodocyclaceae bacterium]